MNNKGIAKPARRLASRVALGTAIAALWPAAALWPTPAALADDPGTPAPAAPAAVATPAVAAVTDATTGTGDASSLTPQDSCPPATPGQATCEAQVMVVKATDQPVAPAVATPPSPDATVTSGGPGLAAAGLRPNLAAPLAQAAPTVTPAAAAEPQPGTPAYFQQAYDLSYLSQTAGSGDTVAIVDAYGYPNAEGDLATFRNTYGLPACTTADGCFRKVDEHGGTNYPSADSGWSVETALDLDSVSSLCPHCHILLVEAASSSFTDLATAEATAANLGANQISNSFSGEGTSAAAVGGNWSYPGVAIVASTGDGGYIGCGAQNCAGYPAAMTTVTAAGGTSLVGATGGRGYSESAWSGAGSGCDTSAAKPSWQTDTGCSGRTYADMSADADPNTGMIIYEGGGWMLVGGTSESSPLIAAYYGLIGSQNQSVAPPHWDYANASLLNDPTGGSNGSCPSGQSYVCNGGSGYDGPTGVGSISGAVVSGAPGIGGPGTSSSGYAQSLQGTSAQLRAGLYPNGLDTTYWWQYGTTTSYGQTTTPVDVGAGTGPVTNLQTISGLTANTSYHIRLVAQNADGTSYGYDTTFTTITTNPPVDTTPPTISGTAMPGYTLTVNDGTWNPVAASYSFQWQRNSGAGATNISGATSVSYTPLNSDVGSRLDVVVTATNAAGSTSVTTASVTVAAGAPISSAAPVVNGTPQRGSVLATSTGTWSPPATSYAYQWQRSNGSGWTNITGAGAATYTSAAGDVGHTLQVVVTATNTFGHASATSAPVGPVAPVPPLNTALPTISGTPQRGSVLTATQGTWGGVGNSYAYVWQDCDVNGANCQNIAGASAQTYTLHPSDDGSTVRVVVTASNSDGSAAADSAVTTPIAPEPPQSTAAPTIGGTPQRGVVLTATAGTWGGVGNTYAYQWQSDGGEGFTNIAGASALTYTPTQASEGASLRIVVTATNPDGTATAVSQGTAVVAAAPPVNTVAPAVSGSAKLGAELTASTGTWTPSGSTFTYAWQRGSAGSGYTNITGATASTYTLTTADVGQSVRVVVSATNVDATVAANSAASAAVTAPPQLQSAPGVPIGTAMQTFELVAQTGTWDSTVASYSYTWLRCPAGATAVTSSCSTAGSGGYYTLTAADVGHEMAVNVTATSPAGSTTAASALTAIVAGLPLTNVTAPYITGNPQIPGTLAAQPGSWSVTPTSVTYAWQRCDTSGQNCTQVATGSGYTLSEADHAHTILVVATANSPGRTQTAQSQPVTVTDEPLPVNTSLPTVTGQAKRTAVLSATVGGWTGSPTLTYQWDRCAANGSSCSPIAGATTTTYTLGVADEGHAITLTITGTNLSGAVTATATPTAAVTADLPVSTRAPSIGGTAQQSVTLTMSGQTWQAPADVSYSDAWERCNSSGQQCQAIHGATAASYVPVAADVGSTLVAESVATDLDGTTTASSAPTAVVLPAAPRWVTTPTLAADPGTVGDTLTITPATWSGPAVTTDTTQVMRCTSTCHATSAAANATSYTISSADVGTVLRVEETASNAGGATAVWSSKYVGPVTSAASGAAVLGGPANGQAAVRNSQGATLATAQIVLPAAAASTATSPARVLRLRRQPGVHGALQAWATAVSGSGGRRPVTAAVTFNGPSATLKLPDAISGKVLVVVSRR